jgi:hypothetical protein
MLVRLGRAEGLVATRAVAESREIIDGDRQVVRTNKVTIGNRRKENARVLVVERLEDGARRVIQHSHPLEAGPAPDSIMFAVDVPAGASLTVSYAAAVEGS